MSKLGPKCQYFVWPPLFSSTALTLLGMEFTRASQIATGVHSSMMTSQSWWMLETLRSSTFRLRMPHRCSIGFRSGDMLSQSITFTLSFFSKAVVVLEVCLGSLSCWNTALRPSLCFSMSQYMLAFMVPSMKEWMNEWSIYIVLYCVLLYTQSALQSYMGISPQPPPVCSIHLDDATAATAQRRQCAHHTPATGGEEREIEPIRWMGIIRRPW